MINRLTAFAFVFFSMTAISNAGQERIYCATSDNLVNMSLETEFSKEDEQRLVHFRGMAGLKSEVAPEQFRKFQIKSDMLRQYWTDNNGARFSLHAFTPEKEPEFRVTMSIVTDRNSKSENRFEGRYQLALQSLDIKKKLKPQTIFTHDAAIYCIRKN